MKPFLILAFLLLIPLSHAFADPETYIVPFDGNGYSVTTDLEIGTIEQIDVATDFPSIILVLSPNSGGSLEISIPRDLLDAKLPDGTDEILEVEFAPSDTVIVPNETQTTATHRTLQINVLANSEEVEIIGTRLGPPSSEPIPSLLSVDAFATHITVGDSVTITGSLITHDGEPIALETINLLEDGVTVATQLSDTNGGYTFNWSPLSDADVTLQLTYSGGTFTDGNSLLESSTDLYSVVVDPSCQSDEIVVNGACQLDDSENPVLNVPELVEAETEDPNGTSVSYEVSATDNLDTDVTISCSHESGIVYPIGSTLVACTATDDVGNTDTKYFSVIVNSLVTDSAAPDFQSIENLTFEAEGPGGSLVEYEVSATDDVDTDVTVSCSHESGIVYPMGTTTVECTATDDAGNAKTGSFFVTVQDTTPPELAVPSDESVETSTGGKVFSFIATAFDNIDGELVTECNPESGSVFSIGQTTISCHATDLSRNTGTGQFTLTVIDIFESDTTQETRTDTTGGTTGGTNDETTGGTNDETTGGTNDETTGGTNDETTGGTNDETTGGTNDETTGGTNDETTGGTNDETTGGTNDETTGGTNDETTGGTNDETTGGTNDETTGGTNDETTGGTNDETTGGTNDETTGGTNDETTGGTNDETTGGTNDETTGGTNEEPEIQCGGGAVMFEGKCVAQSVLDEDKETLKVERDNLEIQLMSEKQQLEVKLENEEISDTQFQAQLAKLEQEYEKQIEKVDEEIEEIQIAIEVDPEPISESEPDPEPEGGGCLIATAAYGSELAPQVQYLRELRDNTLYSTASGVSFMTGFNQIYYSFSPTIADWERQNPIFQESVKIFLTPMLSSLSVMSLAEPGSEASVLGLGISVILLNLGIYIAGPVVAGFKIRDLLKSHNHKKTANLH